MPRDSKTPWGILQLASATLICTLGMIGTAEADTVVFGQIARIETITSAGGAPGNYDFRVYLLGSPVICNGQIWAYVNASDANYHATVANVLAAKATASTGTLHVIQDAAGLCQITVFDYD